MKKYKVKFQLNTWVVDTYAENEDEAYNKARKFAEEELGYDTVKYAEADIEELTNA
jgi:hypothetical protein